MTKDNKIRLSADFSNLDQVLEQFRIDVDKVAERITIKGKTMREALAEQVEWPVYYERRRNEVKTFVKTLTLHKERVHSELFQRSRENYNFELSDRARDRYIMGNADYIVMAELVIEAEELLDQYNSIVEAFKLRGFSLRDHTTLLVNSLQDFTI